VKNYVYLFHVDVPFEDTGESNAAWGAWFESLGEHVVDGGNPFNPEAEAMIKDGVVTMKGDNAAGYAIVKADSIATAVEMAKSCPLATAPGCWVGVHETTPM